MKESLNMLVYKDLYEKIKSQYYKLGQQLPTESELEEIYQVSKAPIRQALAKLQTDGLISRKAGKGTFVSANIKKQQLSFLGGFGFAFAKFEKQLTIKTLEIKKDVAPAEVCQILKIGSRQKLTQLARIRFLDNKPIFYLKHYFLELSIATVEKHSPISNMVEFLRLQDLDLSYVTEKIRAVSADDYLSYLLQLKKGSPLLLIQRTTFTKHYLPHVYAEYYVDSADWPYEIQYSSL